MGHTNSLESWEASTIPQPAPRCLGVSLPARRPAALWPAGGSCAGDFLVEQFQFGLQGLDLPALIIRPFDEFGEFVALAERHASRLATASAERNRASAVAGFPTNRWGFERSRRRGNLVSAMVGFGAAHRH